MRRTMILLTVLVLASCAPEALRGQGKPAGQNPEAKAALEALIKTMESGSRYEIISAAEKVQKAGGAPEALPFFQKLLQHKNKDFRKTAALVLGAMGPAVKAAQPDIEKALDDESDEVRLQAIVSIYNIEPGDPAKLFDKLMKHGNEKVRALAKYGMAAIYVENVHQRVKSKNAVDVLQACEMAKQLKVAKSAVSGLVHELKNEDEDVRKLSALALVQIGPEASKAVPALSVALKDKSASVREVAAAALGAIGPAAKPAVPALQEALNDKEEEVRAVAQKAIEQIEGKK